MAGTDIIRQQTCGSWYPGGGRRGGEEEEEEEGSQAGLPGNVGEPRSSTSHTTCISVVTVLILGGAMLASDFRYDGLKGAGKVSQRPPSSLRTWHRLTRWAVGHKRLLGGGPTSSWAHSGHSRFQCPWHCVSTELPRRGLCLCAKGSQSTWCHLSPSGFPQSHSSFLCLPACYCLPGRGTAQ